MKWILAFCLLISLKSFAQYPFERFRNVKYKTAPFKVTYNERDSSAIAIATYKKYKVELRGPYYSDRTQLIIYNAGRLVQKLTVPGIDFIGVVDPLYLADINGDGTVDLKIHVYNNGSGLAGSLVRKIYLFNDKEGYYRYVSFMDFSVFKERDFDGDGKFEIIGHSLLRHDDHAYWLFDLYHYENGHLVNVSQKYKYPIAVPYLYNGIYKPTRKFSAKQLKSFSLKYPRSYSDSKIKIL